MSADSNTPTITHAVYPGKIRSLKNGELYYVSFFDLCVWHNLDAINCVEVRTDSPKHHRRAAKQFKAVRPDHKTLELYLPH